MNKPAEQITTPSAQRAKPSPFMTVLLSAGAFYLLNTSLAYAAGIMCSAIITLVAGDTSQAISTLGVLGLGIGATFGKVSWGMATLVAVGIATIHGAGLIAGYFGGGCP
jgi:type IV secretory pathway VirB2 component (pilin)